MWWYNALGVRLTVVKNKKVAAQEFHDATVNPNHFKISPKILVQERSWEQPQEDETAKKGPTVGKTYSVMF